MSTARARGEKPGGRTPDGREKATVTRGMAVLFAVIALLIGGLIGYVARGGPDQPEELKVTTPLPVVTVTVPRP